MKMVFRGLGLVAAAGLAIQAGGCGKCGSETAEHAAEVTTATPAVSAITADGAAAVEPAVKPQPEGLDAEAREKILTGLLALEVSGTGRSRATRNADMVALQFDNSAANASGNIGTVEASAGFCVGCGPDTTMDADGMRARIKAELGEIHAENPSLTIELGDFELAPERSGKLVYRRSFVVKDDARASVHTFGVDYFEADRVVRLLAYPRTGFPDSAEAFDKQYSRPELEADVKRVFAAIMPVLWPQTMP